MSTGQLSRTSMLALYRRLLRAAQQFPSVKRAGIISDIRVEFREGARLDGAVHAKKVQLRVQTAMQGLQHMES